jgi:hypothetical protein
MIYNQIKVKEHLPVLVKDIGPGINVHLGIEKTIVFFLKSNEFLPNSVIDLNYFRRIDREIPTFIE